MMADLFTAVRPILFVLEAERAHRLSVRALKHFPVQRFPALSQRTQDPRLSIHAFGLKFPNPVGLAAGFDKHAEIPDTLLALGFGFVEVGGVTPEPQPGNPGPRAFRLTKDRAVINRYGLNSVGVAEVGRRLAGRQRTGIVGVNLGANKVSSDWAGDYVRLVRELAGFVDYLSINISSPNTPGLRNLQAGPMLDDLLGRVGAARDEAAPGCPVLVKISPDLYQTDLDDLIEVAKRRAVDGLIIANTTTSRPSDLKEAKLAAETGGLSGTPLFFHSTRLLAQAYLRVGGAFPLIGVGGIDSVETAFAKILAGASLLQLYTGLIFEGPALIGRINRGLLQMLDRSGFSSLSEATGAKAAEWADGLTTKTCFVRTGSV